MGFASSFLLLCVTKCFGSVQAILPLRGKILNIERKDEAAMYKNEEIQNLILGLGLGVKVILSYYLFFPLFISNLGKLNATFNLFSREKISTWRICVTIRLSY